MSLITHLCLLLNFRIWIAQLPFFDLKFVQDIFRKNCHRMKNPAPLHLSRVLFWETDYDKIDWDNKARYVIERVVTFGFLEDWRAIQQYYGMERIKETVLQARDLDPKTLSFLSLIFNVPQEKFKCFTTIQYNPGHWAY